MKLQINPNIVFRTPQLSFKDSLKDCWEDLKNSIANSSPEFHKLVKDLEYEQLLKMEDSYVHTVWKYFNRARYRATPYGSFAGLGFAQLTGTPSSKLTIANSQVLHRYCDWSCKDQLDISFEEIIGSNARLMANSTYYFTEEGMRYIYCFNGIYEIAEVPKNQLQLQLLEACKSPTPISVLMELLPESVERELFLENMFIDQLLISEFQPNIIGMDYFNRISFKASPTTQDYVIAERKKVGGDVDEYPFRHLPALVERLHQLLPSYESPELLQFIKDFRKKFGDQEVKLMGALDPELGVSYGGLDNSLLSSELILQLQRAGKKEADNAISPTLTLLLPELISRNVSVIDLENLPVTQNTSKAPLPNSVPILCSEANGLLQIEHIGGATANSLLGRFTLALEPVHALSRDIAFREQEANPDVILFDIGYMIGNRVDNVNRRLPVYRHHLNILNYDPTEEASISFDEIRVSVVGNELVLRSALSGKRLVPKLASAYNYLLSDLPAFRLFCDLQHQGTHKNLYLRLIDRIPGLSFYPRVQFRNIIVSPATWRLDYSSFGQRPTQDYQTLLTDHFLDNGIRGYVKVVKGDQTLCVDTGNPEDLKELWTMLSRNGTLHLEESFVPEESKVIDERGQPYVAQYMVSLHHGHEIYRMPKTGRIADIECSVEKKIMPGKGWLYFEIFCHQIRTNDILTDAVTTLLKMHNLKIKNWFFIRYNENGHHIRLRLRLHSEKHAQLITASLAGILEHRLKLGTVSDIVIRTYEREIARYGSANMEKVERHFEADSCYVLRLLMFNFSDTDKYKLCCSLIASIDRSGIIEKELLNAIIQSNAANFAKEHGLGPKQFKALNAEYQKFSLQGSPLLDAEATKRFVAFTGSFIETLGSYSDLQERCMIFGSLLHMHVNRLFQDSQRTHETVIYYYLEKDIKKKAAGKLAV